MDETRQAPVIVMVDDEPEILRLLRQILPQQGYGYEVLAVAQAQEAVTLISQRPWPLLVTDYQLPDRDGLQLARVIKQHNQRVRIGLLTAFPTPDLALQAATAGIDVYLAKPVALDRFEQVIHTLLEAA